MNIKGQCHSVTLVQGNSDSTFAKLFTLERAKPIEAKIRVNPPWVACTKVYSNGLGHMTNMAAIPINGRKHLKSSSLELKSRWP